MNEKHRRVWLHLLGWSLYVAYSVVPYFLYSGYGFKSLMLNISQDFIRITQFYICYLFIFPFWMKSKNWVTLVAGVFGVMLLYTGLRYIIEETLFLSIFGFRNYNPNTTIPYYIFDNMYWSLPGIFLAAVVWGFEATLQKERENRNLKQEKMQAELAFLKSQINPHFLYNTLNYIYSLAYPVSDKLANAIIKLSELMRYMLQESVDGKVELQKEVEYLQNYIDIYRLRFEDKFFVNFDVQGHVNGQRVPALVLIPFVENALKHGKVDDPAAPVQINLEIQENRLYFEVSNHKNQSQKDQTTGIGLANIRRRLDLIYPGKYELSISDKGQLYHTCLKLNNL